MTSLGLPSPDEIAASVERLKARMQNERAQDAPEREAEKPDEGAAAERSDEGAGAAHGEPRPEEKPDAGPPTADAPAPDSEAKGARGDEGEQPRTLKETADGLKTTAKSLYEMEVPLNDGTGRYLSVEDLKAGYLSGEAGSLDAERHEFASEKALEEKRRIEHENHVLRSSRELQDIMALVVDAVPPQQLQKYQQAAQQRAAVEAAKLVEAMPQFRDATVYQGWMKDAGGLMGSYGFTKAEAVNISDHRIYKMLDDFMRLQKRVTELEHIPAPDPKVPRTSTRRAPQQRSGVKAAVAKAKETGSKRDQVTAARMLIEQGAKR